MKAWYGHGKTNEFKNIYYIGDHDELLLSAQENAESMLPSL